MENFSGEQPPRRRSIEELAQLQQRHEEAERLRMEREAQAAQAKLALAAKAEEDLSRRPEILARISELRSAMDAMGGIDAMDERVKASAELKEKEEARVNEMGPIERRLEDAGDRIKAIQGIIEGASQGIAPELAEALKEEEATARAIEQELAPLVAEVRRLQESQISPEELAEYEGMRNEMAGLRAQITEIEGEPVTKTEGGEEVRVMEGAVNERLFEEATTQEQVRETIIQEAMRQIERWDGNDPKVRFVRELCERFLSEEFEASGITAISDDRRRLEAMREFASGIMRGMEMSTERQADEEPTTERQKLVYKGLLLKSLIGKYGNSGTFVRLLRNSEIGGYTSRKSPEELGDALSIALRKHLGVLNFMRGTAASLTSPDRKRAVITHAEGWQGFDNDHRSFADAEFRPMLDGPIVPKEADETTLAPLRETFTRDKEKARKIDETLVIKERADMESRNERVQAEIMKAEAELANLQAALTRVNQAQATIEGVGQELRRNSLYQDIRASLNVLQRALAQEQQSLQTATYNKEHAGVFRFAEKKNLARSIERHQTEITRLSTLLRVVEQLNTRMGEANAIIQHGPSSYNLYRAIDDFERKLENLRKQAQEIQAILAKRQ